jgi:hypothetical protein
MRRLRKLVLSLSVIMTAAHARAQDLWLVVGASDADPSGIVRKAIDTANSREAAQQALIRAQVNHEAAYLKHRRVAAQSLLALKIPAIDSSIAEVPDDAIDWEEKDRISAAVPITKVRAAVILRYYIRDLDDSEEGKRPRVILGDPKVCGLRCSIRVWILRRSLS